MIMKSFSSMHKLQVPVFRFDVFDFLSISQLIEYSFSAFFSLHTCLDNSVSFSYFLFLNDFVWL